MRTPAAAIPLAVLGAALALSGPATARLSKSRSPALNSPANTHSNTDANALMGLGRSQSPGAPAAVLPRDGALAVGDGTGDTVSTGALQNNNPDLRTEVSKGADVGDGSGSTTEKLDQCTDLSGANACASNDSAGGSGAL